MKTKTRKPVSVKRLAKLPKSNGIDSIFVPISKRKGAKLFSRQNKRDTCYAFQKRLHEFGLAPKVFDTFEVEYKGVHYWAYVTQRAEPVCENVNSDENFGRCNNLADAEKSYDVGPLIDALAALGADWRDSHRGNLGFLGDRLVVIDCDPWYFGFQRGSPIKCEKVQ